MAKRKGVRVAQKKKEGSLTKGLSYSEGITEWCKCLDGEG